MLFSFFPCYPLGLSGSSKARDKMLDFEFDRPSPYWLVEIRMQLRAINCLIKRFLVSPHVFLLFSNHLMFRFHIAFVLLIWNVYHIHHLDVTVTSNYLFQIFAESLLYNWHHRHHHKKKTFIPNFRASYMNLLLPSTSFIHLAFFFSPITCISLL